MIYMLVMVATYIHGCIDHHPMDVIYRHWFYSSLQIYNLYNSSFLPPVKPHNPAFNSDSLTRAG